MTLAVLISCMHQTDYSIIERTNIQGDVVVVNQCNEDKIEEWTFRNKKGEECHAKFISTTERGLSRSRNMALRNAKADICLICDDDEILDDDYEIKILSTFQNWPSCSCIAFNLHNPLRSFPKKEIKLSYLQALRLASYQLSFKKQDLIRNNLSFDETMGAGITMGGGEENKLLFDVIRSGLKGIYVPILIGSVRQEVSTWSVNSSNYWKYFYDRGQAYSKIMGKYWGSLYILYSSFRKRKIYSRYCSLMKSIQFQFRGLRKRNL